MQKDHQESTEANSVPKKCTAQLKLITAYIDFNHRRMLTNRRTLSCNTLFGYCCEMHQGEENTGLTLVSVYGFLGNLISLKMPLLTAVMTFGGSLSTQTIL